MPSSNPPPEQRLRRLEQEMAFIRSQGLSKDEHDRLLEESPEGNKESGKAIPILLGLNLVLTFAIILFLGWKEWVEKPQRPGDQTGGEGLEEFESPSNEPLPFHLPSRK